MHIEEIGVDDSVAAVFSPERLAKRLGDLPVDARVVDGSLASRSTCDAVVTLEHRESFLDLDWVHSIQAGVDRFPHDRFREDGVVLTDSTGIHGDAVGETVAGFVLALARRLHDHVAHQTDREWARPAWDDGWTVADELAAMREDAYLVNVARGGVVDQPALVEALRTGAVAGGALDVFET